MSFKHHTSCSACGSTDANAVYEDNTYCWACQKSVKTNGDNMVQEEQPKEPKPLPDLSEAPIRGFRERGITRNTSEFFGVRCIQSADETITHHFYPYTTPEGTEVIAYKERIVEGKKFRTLGSFGTVALFGQSLFPPGGRKIIVTEGELDAMAVAQGTFDKYKTFYPVVSVPSGATAVKAVLVAREYLRSFDEVVLMMDSDEAGQLGQARIAKIIGSDRVKIATMKQKDPSDVYLAEGSKGIMDAVWNAQNWCPAGIMNSKDTWDQYKEESEAVYTPWPPFVQGLTDKIYGRRLGSITTFTSGTGSGKTSFLREDMHHLMLTTEDRIGVCSLEESIGETVRGFISLDLSKRIGLPGVEADEEEQRGAWERTLGTGRYELLDHQGSVSDDSLLDKIEYMANVCTYIYLDHITIAISDAEGNVNVAMDKFMNELLKIAKRHNVWIGVVSHLRKSNNDQTSFEEGAAITEDSMKGSGSLKQISAQIIALERNKNAENQSDRNTVKVRVLKDRFCGETGLAATYKFDFNTGRLRGVDVAPDFDDLT